MRISSFKLALIITIASTTILSAVLASLLITSGPRIRLVDFERDPATTSLQRGSTITLQFDRPIIQRDYTGIISFSPEMKFSSRTTAQSIIITLNQNYLHNYEYDLRVAPGVLDTSEKTMDEQFVHTFNTGDPSYAYIERSQSSDDIVYEQVLESDKNIVYRHPIIVHMAANEGFYVVAQRENDQDSIVSIDRNSGDQIVASLPFDGEVQDVAVSPFGDVALFILSPKFDERTPDEYEENSFRVFTLDLNSGAVESVKNEDGSSLRGFVIVFDPTGQLAVVRDINQNYVYVSPFNDIDPILLSSRPEILAISGDGSQILFRDVESVYRYDTQSGIETEVNLPDNGSFVRQVEFGNESVFFSTTQPLSNQKRYTVYKTDRISNDESNAVWSNFDEISDELRSFNLSYDDEIIALQTNEQNCEFDQVSANPQCVDSVITLKYTNTNLFIDTFPGFDLTWLP